MRDYLQINIKAAPPFLIVDRTTSQCNHVRAQIEFWPICSICSTSELFRFQKHLKNGNEETVEVERCFWTTWRTTLREHLCMDWSETFKRCEIVLFLFLYLLAGTSPSQVGPTLNGFCGFFSAVQESSLQFSSSSQVIQISTWYF